MKQYSIIYYNNGLRLVAKDVALIFSSTSRCLIFNTVLFYNGLMPYMSD